MLMLQSSPTWPAFWSHICKCDCDTWETFSKISSGSAGLSNIKILTLKQPATMSYWSSFLPVSCVITGLQIPMEGGETWVFPSHFQYNLCGSRRLFLILTQTWLLKAVTADSTSTTVSLLSLFCWIAPCKIMKIIADNTKRYNIDIIIDKTENISLSINCLRD